MRMDQSKPTYCQNCGQQIRGAATFCDHCGTDLTANDSEQQTHQQNRTDNRNHQQSNIEREQPSSPTITALSAYTTGQQISVVGSVITVFGAFLPWFSVDILGTQISKTGIEADGRFTTAFALLAVAVIVYVRSDWGRKSAIGVVILGTLTAFMAIGYISDPLLGVESDPENAEQFVEVGIGLYLTAVGGVLMLGGPILDKFSRN